MSEVAVRIERGSAEAIPARSVGCAPAGRVQGGGTSRLSCFVPTPVEVGTAQDKSCGTPLGCNP